MIILTWIYEVFSKRKQDDLPSVQNWSAWFSCDSCLVSRTYHRNTRFPLIEYHGTSVHKFLIHRSLSPHSSTPHALRTEAQPKRNLRFQSITTYPVIHPVKRTRFLLPCVVRKRVSTGYKRFIPQHMEQFSTKRSIERKLVSARSLAIFFFFFFSTTFFEQLRRYIHSLDTDGKSDKLKKLLGIY